MNRDDDQLTLFQLNNIVRGALKQCFPDRIWVRAELSEVREAGSGHCYLELVEKDPRTDEIIAKARGNIWRTTWLRLRPLFEEATGQKLTAGIKVLVEVSIELSELYGYSLTIANIDPSYTLGDMARHRAEILQKLEADGVRDMNRELTMTPTPQRIAVISSATAAGYGDFIDQLTRCEQGYAFYPHLFPALMQGSQAAASIIEQLDRINRHVELFDVVVIIRGGGATSDLNCFDNYPLALNVAQFPLPIIVGIGHDRDETVLDSIAHTRVKTPTAAAEFLISRMDEAAARIVELRNRIEQRIGERMLIEKGRLTTLTQRIPLLIEGLIEREKGRMRLAQADIRNRVGSLIEAQKHAVQVASVSIPQLISNRVSAASLRIDYLSQSVCQAIPMRLDYARMQLDGLEKIVNLTSPESILRKGYTLTTSGGRIVRSLADLHRGDRITLLLADGQAEALVTDLKHQ